MIERRGGERFGAQPAGRAAEQQAAVFERLDGDGPVQLDVGGLVDDAHAADAEAGDDAVAPADQIGQRPRCREPSSSAILGNERTSVP